MKQVWRILQESASLSAQILKAVYFPQGDLIEANLGSTPSEIWRSILDGREVLQLGLIRRIGTCSTTSVWHRQRFVSSDSHSKPYSALSDRKPCGPVDYSARRSVVRQSGLVAIGPAKCLLCCHLQFSAANISSRPPSPPELHAKCG